MERRRVAVVLAGLVLVGGAVAALRLAGGTPNVNATPPPPPLPTTVKAYSAEGVLAPGPGGKPAKPGQLTVVAGSHRLQVSWPDAKGATGYDVRWGNGGALDHEVLVSEPDTEIDGLAPNTATRVAVRSVDSYGQRSAATTATGTAQSDPPAGPDNAFVDNFDGPPTQDPTKFELNSVSGCAQAGRGAGAGAGELVVLTQCGQASATLRARSPLRLRASGPELGRFTIDTDAPGESGELDVDLVPGSVLMINGSANDPITNAPPNVAALDSNLPNGTIRVRIAATVNPATSQSSDTVQVAAGPGTRTVAASTTAAHAMPAPRVGMSARWDVVVRTDGIQVLRNGVYVGGGNVVPQWTQANALVEFSGPNLDQQREDIHMIGFGGAPTSAPRLTASPSVALGSFTDVAPGSSATAINSTATGPGTGRLLMTVIAIPNTPTAKVTVNGKTPKFGVSFGKTVFAAAPAVAGTPLLPQVRYALVATIPADALRGVHDLPISLVVDAPKSYPIDLELVAAKFEVTPGPGVALAHPAWPTDLTEAAQLPALNAQVFDASGRPLAQGALLPRGRAVLDVSMDAVSTLRTAGQQSALAGVAGFEVWLDNDELAAVPTAVNGPAVGGDWRIAFDPSDAPPGSHTIDVRGYGAQHGVSFTETFTSFQLGST